MTELADWLRTQLDLDEAHARKDLHCLAEASPDWKGYYGFNLPYSRIMSGDVEIGRMVGGESEHNANTMIAVRLVKLARGRALATLADVAAKRRIVDLDDSTVLRLLAIPYAGRPGFDQEWSSDAVE